MRRRQQEITDPHELESILHEARVCRIGLVDGTVPYLVPVCYGYGNQCLYVHSAREGKKLDIIRKNNNVCFEVDIDVDVVSADDACKWTVKYRSVIGYGKAYLVDDPTEKVTALNSIMEHYSGHDRHDYQEQLVNLAAIIRIEIESMTGKRSKT